MIVATNLNAFPAGRFSNLVLTLGVFDGVHRGHHAVLNRLAQSARKIKGQSAVLTFQQNPRKILMPSRPCPLLTDLPQKLSLLGEQGVDLCVALRFTKQLAALSATKFVEKILVQKFNVKKIVLGHDTRFGHQQRGDEDLLRSLSTRYGFELEVVREITQSKSVISSSAIRSWLQEGDLVNAQKFLGRPYTLWGQVVKGRGMGKRLGFPTANLRLPKDQLLPPGVFAVRVHFSHPPRKLGKACFQKWKFSPEKRSYYGVMNIGRRPTFSGKSRPSAEIHLLGFCKSIYGKWLVVDLVKRRRGEMAFQSPGALKEQITKDVKWAQSYFSKRS